MGMRYSTRAAAMSATTVIHDMNGTKKLVRLLIRSTVEAIIPMPFWTYAAAS